ncbi:MAG: DUF4224 domain-containing protein [Candidatus Accumulibacter phosphatis]
MRLSPETLYVVTGRKQRTAQARWFMKFMGADVPCDERGPILTESAYQQLLLKRLGLVTDAGAKAAGQRPVVRLRSAA